MGVYEITKIIIEQKITLKDILWYFKHGFKIVKCPVCGKYSFDDHYICRVCRWEYDSILDEEEYSLPNGTTLEWYKSVYLDNGAKLYENKF